MAGTGPSVYGLMGCWIVQQVVGGQDVEVVFGSA